jgi:secreted trypsin-like serine protease
MKRFAGVMAAAACCAACVAPSSSSPPIGSASQAIINGVTDSNDDAVVMVLSQVPGSMNASLCTGEVVSPHVVLTAAHCVDPRTVGTGATTLVFPDQTLSMTSQHLAAQATHFDPAFDPDPSTVANGHDVGVVILANPTTIAPVPYNRDPIPTTMVGSAARLVGYGITDAGDTTGMTAGTRRTAPTTLAHLDMLFVGLQDGAHGICEGDSGGPAFMTFNGTERIVGVTSFGFTGCPLTATAQEEMAGFEAGNDTRIDTFADFVDQWVLMFDPPPKGPGDMCTSDADCAPRTCEQTSVGKICAQSCDPAAMPATCPAGTTCTNVDGSNLCVTTAAMGGGGSGGKGGGGCDVGGAAAGRGGGAAGGAALALAFAAIALGRARRRNI